MFVQICSIADNNNKVYVSFSLLYLPSFHSTVAKKINTSLQQICGKVATVSKCYFFCVCSANLQLFVVGILKKTRR